MRKQWIHTRLSFSPKRIQVRIEPGYEATHSPYSMFINVIEQSISGKQPSPEQIELRLIQSKEDIESPPRLQLVLGIGLSA